MPPVWVKQRGTLQPLFWLALAAATAILSVFLASSLGAPYEGPLVAVGWLAMLAAATSALTFAFRMGDAATESGRGGTSRQMDNAALEPAEEPGQMSPSGSMPVQAPSNHHPAADGQ